MSILRAVRLDIEDSPCHGVHSGYLELRIHQNNTVVNAPDDGFTLSLSPP